MSHMLELLNKIYPLRMAPASAGTDRSVELLCNELPFVVHKYPCGDEHNGWVVPLKWEVRRAEIRKDGRLIYDGLAHPLGVIGYSSSFHGTLPLVELKKHLFSHPVFPDGLVYHCDLYYKAGRSNWGFTMPRNVSEQLEDGDYEIRLDATHEPGTMKVCDYFLPGELTDTILLNAHNCHAAQANDDIAGVVVGVEVLKRLAQRKNRFSYRLIIAPEHFGSIFYLANLAEETAATLKYGFFLEMLGNDHRLALQETFTGQSELDRAAHHYLRHYHSNYVSGKFRKIIGNDETVWEAAGFEIPTVSLSRFPYPQYHSSLDTADIILDSRLEEAAETVLGIINIFETNCVMRRKFKGLVALSNPKYNLYIDQADPSIRPSIGEEQQRWNYLMDCLPRYFDERTTILDIAERHQLPFDKLREYVTRFADKGLVEMIPLAGRSR